MQKLYGIGQYDSCEHFLYLKARRFGNIGRGGVPDIFTSARSLVEDWNRLIIKLFLMCRPHFICICIFEYTQLHIITLFC